MGYHKYKHKSGSYYRGARYGRHYTSGCVLPIISTITALTILILWII